VLLKPSSAGPWISSKALQVFCETLIKIWAFCMFCNYFYRFSVIIWSYEHKVIFKNKEIKFLMGEYVANFKTLESSWAVLLQNEFSKLGNCKHCFSYSLDLFFWVENFKQRTKYFHGMTGETVRFSTFPQLVLKTCFTGIKQWNIQRVFLLLACVFVHKFTVLKLTYQWIVGYRKKPLK